MRSLKTQKMFDEAKKAAGGHVTVYPGPIVSRTRERTRVVFTGSLRTNQVRKVLAKPFAMKIIVSAPQVAR